MAAAAAAASDEDDDDDDEPLLLLLLLLLLPAKSWFWDARPLRMVNCNKKKMRSVNKRSYNIEQGR